MKVRKAVIPAAGLGTRFLPATKVQPKEMLPVVDKPVIQYVIEEIAAAGIRDVLIITGKGKQVIEDHFDKTFELEHLLMQRGREDMLKEIKALTDLVDIHYIRQREQRGLGDAIRCAKGWVGDEPFAVLLGDTIMVSEIPETRKLIELHNNYGKSIIAVESVPREQVGRYGIVKGKQLDDSVYLIEDLVEKPSPEAAPSTLAITGRYVLTPEIFDAIDSTRPGVDNEVQLTDALRILMAKEKMYAFVSQGKRYDIGTKLDYLKAIIELSLARKDLGKDIREHIRGLI